jgi:hypothetical protein
MVEVVARLALGAVLLVSAASKLASPRSTQAALSTFGVGGERLRRLAWGALVSTELALGAAVIAGLRPAAYVAAGLMVAFAAGQLVAMRSGRAGAPCACFGSRSRVGWPGIARNFVLAVAFAALPLLPRESLTTDQWLALGLGVSLLACAALGVVVLSLAREVGMLRLQLGPQAALEIPGEGPELGSRTALIDRFQPGDRTELALAVFVSDGCHMCRALEPSIASLAREPILAVETFEEAGDAAIWGELQIPGSPYAVALDLDGAVLAKGTFNTLGQLESVLATAERRRAQTAGATRA